MSRNAPPDAGPGIHAFLEIARRRGASDLHIGAGRQPFLRKDGELTALGGDPLDPDLVERLLFEALTPEQATEAREKLQIEVRLQRPDGRYRVGIIKHRIGWDGCFHIIAGQAPDPADLGLPDALVKLTDHRNGLILISGPRGSGKTTTLASLINRVSQTRPDHVITIEDPVEYRITSERSIVSQRTVGLHTETFASALRVALREDPDVIAVGDLRDHETMSMAVTASETGHLVLACLNTGSVAGSITRVIDSFPPDQAPQIRTMLSESLRGVISQRLVPRIDQPGRVLAYELLVNTQGIGAQIRENRFAQMRTSIQTGRKHGMQLLDDSLAQLVRESIIDSRVARRLAESPERIAGG